MSASTTEILATLREIHGYDDPGFKLNAAAAHTALELWAQAREDSAIYTMEDGSIVTGERAANLLDDERRSIRLERLRNMNQILALRSIVESFLEHTEVPPRNCSCHIAPPCSDCVENGGIRELCETARNILKITP